MEQLSKWARGQWDRLGAWIAFALAVVLLFLGWRGTSDSVFTAQQIPYLISGGMGGLLLCALAATLWLSADLRDEWRKLDEIHDELRALAQADRPDAASVVDARPVVAPSPEVDPDGDFQPAPANGNRSTRARPVRARARS